MSSLAADRSDGLGPSRMPVSGRMRLDTGLGGGFAAGLGWAYHFREYSHGADRRPGLPDQCVEAFGEILSGSSKSWPSRLRKSPNIAKQHAKVD
jgi:hypothetical protein